MPLVFFLAPACPDCENLILSLARTGCLGLTAVVRVSPRRRGDPIAVVASVERGAVDVKDLSG